MKIVNHLHQNRQGKDTSLTSCHSFPLRTMMTAKMYAFPAILLGLMSGIHPARCLSLSSSSVFHGTPLQQPSATTPSSHHGGAASFLEMRKQKASDRRTRRLQRGDIAYIEELVKSTNSYEGAVTSSPMSGKSWRHKQTHSMQAAGPAPVTGGRGRSRKRSALYNSLSLYHNKFLSLLTEEYKQEVSILSIY